MASIDSYDELKTLMAESSARGEGCFSFGFGNGSWASSPSGFVTGTNRMAVRGNPSAPSVPVALYANDSTLIAPFMDPQSTAKFWITELEMNYGSNNMTLNQKLNLLLYDRLCQSGGFSGIVTTEQTINLPTAPLPRYTSGKGVMAFLEVYSGIGGTTTTVSIRYTNEKGEANRISPPTTIGGSSSQSLSAYMPMTLQAGDRGVRSVEGVTLAGSTGTTGNFAIVLAKVLSTFPTDTSAQNERTPIRFSMFSGGMVEVMPDACLHGLLHNPNTNTGAQWVLGRVGVVSK